VLLCWSRRWPQAAGSQGCNALTSGLEWHHSPIPHAVCTAGRGKAVRNVHRQHQQEAGAIGPANNANTLRALLHINGCASIFTVTIRVQNLSPDMMESMMLQRSQEGRLPCWFALLVAPACWSPRCASAFSHV